MPLHGAFPGGMLSRSTTVSEPPPPSYQPVASEAESVSPVGARMSHEGPRPLPIPSASSRPGENPKKPPSRMEWDGADGYAEHRPGEGAIGPWASSSSSSYHHSPTFGGSSSTAPMYPITASGSGSISELSTNGHLYVQQPENRSYGSFHHPHNGIQTPGLPSSPPNSLGPDHRRASVASNDWHLPPPMLPVSHQHNGSNHSHGSGGSQHSPEPSNAVTMRRRDSQQHSPTAPVFPSFDHVYSPIGQLRSEVAMYVFRSCGFNSMILYTLDGVKRYHIEVAMNCFMPTSFLTTIRRGSQDGQFVASFEMGISHDKGTLTFGAASYWLSEVFSNFRTGIRSNAKGRWTWSRGGNTLEWSSATDPTSTCRDAHDTRKKTLAKLIPPSKADHPRDTLLEVHVSAQHLLDDLVVSAIIVERKRQSPTNGTHNEDLFN